MAIRKSMSEEFVVSGDRMTWLVKCTKALESHGFTKIVKNETLFQIEATYRQFPTYGSIVLTFIPTGNDTKINAQSTANVDNIYALFKSPNRCILDKFKEGLG